MEPNLWATVDDLIKQAASWDDCGLTAKAQAYRQNAAAAAAAARMQSAQGLSEEIEKLKERVSALEGRI
ncbi:hypothetical protein ACIBKY_51510 [Nonomuraea sp. NPDC050394]|uniref:hypothetical protein n=1 Tax=Nonomuraea sp. NPDC050394 TaxID=3364363 RepID=UPI0037998356